MPPSPAPPLANESSDAFASPPNPVLPPLPKPALSLPNADAAAPKPDGLPDPACAKGDAADAVLDSGAVLVFGAVSDVDAESAPDATEALFAASLPSGLAAPPAVFPNGDGFVASPARTAGGSTGFV